MQPSFTLNIKLPVGRPKPAAAARATAAAADKRPVEAAAAAAKAKAAAAGGGGGGEKERVVVAPPPPRPPPPRTKESATASDEKPASVQAPPPPPPPTTQQPRRPLLAARANAAAIALTPAAASPSTSAASPPPIVGTRKNPVPQPRVRAPLELAREISKAPKEEAPARESQHLIRHDDSFAGLGLHPDLVAHLTRPVAEGGMGLERPTLVQTSAVPALLSGRDALVKSETGSGKTLAYVLPVLHSLASEKNRISRADGLFAVFLAPTRELCLQIFDVLTKASKPFHWIIASAVVGGEKKKSEKARLRKGVNVLVATPGRLADHLRTTRVIRDSLEARPLRWLVLDECDRLMDAGFERQVDEIIEAMEQLSAGANKAGGDKAGETQTQKVLLSATVSSGVERLAGRSLRDPVRVQVASGGAAPPVPAAASASATATTNAAPDAPPPSSTSASPDAETFVTPKQLVQHYMVVESRDRLVALAAFVRRHVRRTGNSCKALVFVASRAVAEFLFAVLSRLVWDPVASEDEHIDEEVSAGAVAGSANAKRPRPANAAAAAAAPTPTPDNDNDETTRNEAVSDKSGLGTRWFVLHGNVDQNQRRRTVKDFAGVRGGFLICTDVAARGLDLPAVDLVVQYDAPTEVSEYVHRVGRTARQGRHGTAVLFLREAELAYLNVLGTRGLKLKPIKTSYEALIPGTFVGPAAAAEEAAAVRKQELQRAFEKMVSESEDLTQLARDGFQSYVGAFAVHSADTKHIFVARALHLGHVARAFGLREEPRRIQRTKEREAERKAKIEAVAVGKALINQRGGGAALAKLAPKRDDARDRPTPSQVKRRKLDISSEFAAG